MTPPTATWRGLVTVALSVVAVVLLAEVFLHRLAPMPRRDLEVDTGVEALAEHDPEVLVLGSSHAGAYLPLIDRLGADRVAVVTEEGGTFSAFDWVYRHRLQGLIEEKRRLKEFLLVTTYWDTCPLERTHWTSSLPARAWLWPHYLADFARHGVTPENRNFPFTSMKRLFGESMMIQDRGLENLRSQLKGAGSPDSLAGRKAAWRDRRRGEIPEEGRQCHRPEELERLEGLVDLAQARGLSVTIVAFPLMSELLSEDARQSALRIYAEYLADLKRRKGVRIVDHTTTAPMVYDDFEIDCDHLTPPAREKYIDWALDHGLEFLRQGAAAK